MQRRAQSDEVFYSAEPLVQVALPDVEGLARQAVANPRQRARLCAHPSEIDRLHEMLIVHTSGTYVRPHRHHGKSESFHIIEGSLAVVLFGDDGTLDGHIPMGDYRSGKCFFYRLNEPRYHSMLITSPVVVFHEVTNGPFDRADTTFPVWAPDGTDAAAAADYLARLRASLSSGTGSPGTGSPGTGQ